ncbi:hypothetical protein [Haloechinothrix sp. LS1_15]|uniref:hypothetical protein n=1 Tax=Haloechinothrix sp. LS1_15 TaxID=2652248 RepID=UPI00294B7614|nr:hypothetical protein [Haloechinothrix sp. LS1_15]
MTYQVCTTVLTKRGAAELACVTARRGYDLAEQAEERIVLASLSRSVSHALLAAGRCDDALGVISDAAERLGQPASSSSPTYVSVYGTMCLTGSMAAARARDRTYTKELLREARAAAQRIGTDANLLWTAFGPTNVAVHAVSTAMELGDAQQALELGTQVDAKGLPTERRARHDIELARAHSAIGDRDTAVQHLLAAEHAAPEQVRSHPLSRQLARTWVHRTRNRPDESLNSLATRLGVG